MAQPDTRAGRGPEPGSFRNLLQGPAASDRPQGRVLLPNAVTRQPDHCRLGAPAPAPGPPSWTQIAQSPATPRPPAKPPQPQGPQSRPKPKPAPAPAAETFTRPLSSAVPHNRNNFVEFYARGVAKFKSGKTKWTSEMASMLSVFACTTESELPACRLPLGLF